MKRTIAHLIDAAFNRYAPTVHTRSAAAFTSVDTNNTDADLLADVEQHFDSLPPWQRGNHDDWPDELWAAMQRHPAGHKLADNQTADDFVRENRHLFAVPNQPSGAGDLSPGPAGSQPPAGAEAMTADLPPSAAASANGAGGFPTEADLKVTVSRVLRDCGVTYPTTTAGILTRELLHHFEFRHK